jgi:hypothetical protein
LVTRDGGCVARSRLREFHFLHAWLAAELETETNHGEDETKKASKIGENVACDET